MTAFTVVLHVADWHPTVFDEILALGVEVVECGIAIVIAYLHDFDVAESEVVDVAVEFKHYEYSICPEMLPEEKPPVAH